MDSAAMLEKLRKQFTFVPVPGKPNMVILAPGAEKTDAVEAEQMTEADWDKFEADIEEAFEQVP